MTGNNTPRGLFFLFFISGFPALLYQVIWQRTLFSIFGVNIESVTVVVTAFMLGLGLGSTFGGWLSARPSLARLTVFGLVELAIAAFGLVSLRLFHWVAGFTAGVSAFETFWVTFVLVLLPTILMGATLPLLVAELVHRSGNVGRAVGMLYFANTLGSAVACFAAALLTMRYLGMSGSILLAAACNVTVGLSTLLLYRRPAGVRLPAVAVNETASQQLLPFSAGLAIAAISGFISLGYEIVFYRVYSFASGGSPRCFSFVLGAFLTGIAFGSLGARHLCKTAESRVLIRSIAALVLLGNVVGFLSVPVLAWAVQYASYEFTLPLAAVAAGLLGATFPLVCHISVDSHGNAGPGLSYLYLSNIVGSAAGSFLMGYVLMDLLSLRAIAVLLAGFGIATALVILTAAGSGGKVKVWAAGFAAFAIVYLSAPSLFGTLYERLLFKDEYETGMKFTDIVETRSGVVTVDSDRLLYGGGARDGVLTTQLLTEDNCIRPFSLSFIHPSPKDVLLVGVAGGAWSQIVANHPQVERAIAVEINPGYLEIIRRYREVAPVLKNPKLQIVVDDGRRWMAANSTRKFDAILMDTVQHWRSNATNLLSVEMLTMARGMLKPGGVIYYNTTYSDDAQLTGVTLFANAIRFGPFLAVSEMPLLLDEARWRRIMMQYKLDGHAVLDAKDPAALRRLEQLAGYLRQEDSTGSLHLAVELRESIQRRTAYARIITDDNMASEWKK